MGRRTDQTEQKRPRPLVATDDPDLLDDLLRLSSASLVEVDVATSLAATRGRWTSAPLVVLGADVLELASSATLPRRSGVVVVARDSDAQIWQRSVAVGADDVVFLPAGESALIERLSATESIDQVPAPVLAVLGARGGAGATTLAASLGVTAASLGLRACVVDLDPTGPGIQVVMGCDEIVGVSWNDVAHSRGRVPSATLIDGLPQLAGARVLTWPTGPCVGLLPSAAGSVIDALARASDVVVVDLPRKFDDSVGEIICRAERLLLVAPTDVRSVAAAARLLSSAVLDGVDLRLVARSPSHGGLTADEVASALGVPLGATLRNDRSLDPDLEAGMPPASRRRSNLWRTSNRLLAEVGLGS